MPTVRALRIIRSCLLDRSMVILIHALKSIINFSSPTFNG